VKRQQSEIDQLKQDVASIKNMIASLNGAAASTPSTGAAITPPVNATPAIPAPMLQQSLKPRTVNPYAAYAFEGEQVSPQVLRLAIQTVRESLTTRFGKVPERLAKLLDDPASVQKIIDQTQKELKDMRAIMHKVDQEPLQIQNSGK
jgi:hypothetical protein